MTALPLTLKEMRAPDRAQRWACLVLSFCRRLLALGMLAVLVAGGSIAAHAAEPVKGEIRVVTDGGYARLVFRFEEAIDAKVRVSGAIVVIEFKQPVAVAVDRINAGARDYISAARSDPDGMAIRIALARKLIVNSIPAAERLYVDLLPEPWNGLRPGLPQEVVDELAARTRAAEAQLNKQRLSAKQKETPLVRVKVAKLPTFMRYVFDMPPSVSIRPERGDGKLSLRFDHQVKWDLADAKATLPPTVLAVDAEADFDSVAVVFQLAGTPEVRSFHEDRSFIVDIGSESKPDGEEAADAQKAAAAKSGLAIAPPDTVPAKDAPAVKNAAAPKDAPAIKDAPATKDAPAAKPVKEPTKEPAKQSAKEPEQKVTANEPVKAPAKEPVKDFVDIVPPMDASPPQRAAAAAVSPPAPVQEAMPAPVPAAVLSAMAAAPVPPTPAPINAAAAPGPQPAAKDEAVIAAIVNLSGENMRIEFPFATPTPAAVFRRSETLWLVFDNAPKIDLAALTRGVGTPVRKATFTRGPAGEGIVRLRLARPLLASAAADGPGWIVTVGDTVTQPTAALAIARTVLGKGKATIVIPFNNARQVHAITDPDLGDRLMIVTALAPARGLLKGQDFVELRTLSSTHGVAVQPIADDLTAAIEEDKIIISRPGGLSLSSAAVGPAEQQAAPSFRAMTFDTQTWGFDRQAPYRERQAELIALAAAAPVPKRRQARFDLARFYLAREMGAEAKAVLDVALSDQKGGDDVTGSVLKAVADVMLNRPEEALKELAAVQVGDQQDAPIWRAIAQARHGQWSKAYAGFKASDNAMRALPIEMQRMAMTYEMRSAIEVRDFAVATRVLNEFETMGIPAEQTAEIQVLSGRLYESLGRKEDALTAYRAAAASRDRRAAAQGRLREIELLNATGDMPRNEVIHQLETLTTAWRGDETESGGLRLLAHLYTEENRYRDAFHVMRTALLAHPNSDMTRKIQDEAARTFDSLFLAGKGDSMPPVEALGLFYDFRQLTPIGRRGDEMIRRLADRLVSVDLLDQAAELLQHQVDNRLSGAARAQVATRLAVVYLMNRKPDRALSVLQKTRIADLSNELREQRLLLEARAISDSGRHELAIEVIANIKGREAIRLRSDILWAAKRWRDAAEQIELMYGNRWREFTPLTDNERADIMRAAIGYAMSDEQLSLSRLREKYAVKFADGPDRRAFDVVSTPVGTSGEEFQDIASKAVNTNTLEGFLRDLRARYPDAPMPEGDAAAPGKDAPGAAKDAKTPVAAAKPPAPAKSATTEPADAAPPKLPVGVPLKPDKTPTGSISPRQFKQRMPPTFGGRR
jgi:tetratricopeptide (TPR) repeat protein